MGLTITGGIIFIGGVELIATSSPGPSPSGNAWEISTATFTTSSNVATSPTGLFLSDDSTKMYIIGSDGDSIYQYNLSVAWDISTASYQSTLSIAEQDNNPHGIVFKPDGTKIYFVGKQNNKVYEFSTDSNLE